MGARKQGWLAAVAAWMAAACLSGAARPEARSPGRPTRYYAHAAVLDGRGVIAPWYSGANGQFDWRVRIAAETLKRYPWTEAPSRAPHFIFNGTWAIDAAGAITVPKLADWDNGDLGQRAAYVLGGMVDYYRYTGDAAALRIMHLQAEALLRHGLTPAGRPWPRFPVTVPNRGKPYGRPDPRGFIQIDIAAEIGIPLIRAAEIMGRPSWLAAARDWGLQIARHMRHGGAGPWSRYANPGDVAWEDLQTGGVAFILEFMEELLRTGYAGPRGEILRAREAGRRFLRDVLLPRWSVDDTWGRNYWDWNDNVQAENVTEFVCRYLMDHRELYPNWRADVANILGIFLNRTSVAPESGGDVFSGAWAFPESSSCCGRSLWYGPLELAMVWLQHGELSGDARTREIGRRMAILSTYDGHESGVVEDNIDGGQIVAGAWFKIAHPMALKHALGAIAWAPAELGARGEDHIVRSASTVTDVSYTPGRVAYAVAHVARPAEDVLRLAFLPRRVLADGRPLRRRAAAASGGWSARPLPGGDWLVRVWRGGAAHVEVTGPATGFSRRWAGGAAQFAGGQVRIVGDVGPDGGMAEVRVDGRLQAAGIDAWSPARRRGQTLFALGGLTPGAHTVDVRPTGGRNPVSSGSALRIAAIYSAPAPPVVAAPASGGPTNAQRVVFGFTGRTGIVDCRGARWRPATEFVVRLVSNADVVARSWWTTARRHSVEGTQDPELYRYGVHARELTHYFTVGPGVYHVRLRFAETRYVPAGQRAFAIAINGRPTVGALDVAATAGGMGRAADVVFNGVRPEHGVIAIRLTGQGDAEAIIQAAEIGPGRVAPGARIVEVVREAIAPASGPLANPGFEGLAGGGVLGSLGDRQPLSGWVALFLGPSRGYAWAETDYAAHPDWGMPVIHTGAQALRTHVDTEGRNLIYQEAPARPGTAYRASVWVLAANLRGRGFGNGGGDRAALIVQEIAADGRIIVSHPPAAVTRNGPWTELVRAFTSASDTARIRFILEADLHCAYNEGHVTFDDCRLAVQDSGVR